MIRTWSAEFAWVCRNYPNGKFVYILHKLGEDDSIILGMRGMVTWKEDFKRLKQPSLARAYRLGLERGNHS